MHDRWSYWKRVFKVYFSKEPSYLTFWHEDPAVSENIKKDELGPYYMTFADKARYAGPKDKDGVILFDYYFDIGRQYNPLAVAQYGLGHWNLYLEKKEKGKEKDGRAHFDIAKIQADWLVENLEPNDFGIPVWKHKFRWHYKKYLEPGWFSAHSQGTGISLLARLYRETNDRRYLDAAEKAFRSLNLGIEKGGVKFVDGKNNVWLEEYLIDPPSHILNGFLWALWSVWDYYLLTKDIAALRIWNDCVKTLKENLPRYDAGFWSLYDLSKQAMKMLASPFYHKLHIVQLKIMHILTGEPIFDIYAKKFEKSQSSWLKRKYAFLYKILFKIIYF